MYRSPSCLWLLPDLGMDARLLAPQAEAFANFASPPLPRYSEKEDLAGFASRSVDLWLTDRVMAEQVQRRCFLGGIGFGGILALELALALAMRSLRPAGVFLIASARSQASISTTSRISWMLLARLPPAFGRWRLAKKYQKLAKDESVSDAQRRILHDMAGDIDWAMFRWQVQALSDWRRSRSEWESSCIPIHQLHGRGDPFYCNPAVEDATILIHGKHLINLSLSGEVNRWIESILRDDELRQAHRRES